MNHGEKVHIPRNYENVSWVNIKHMWRPNTHGCSKNPQQHIKSQVQFSHYIGLHASDILKSVTNKPSHCPNLLAAGEGTSPAVDE